MILIVKRVFLERMIFYKNYENRELIGRSNCLKVMEIKMHKAFYESYLTTKDGNIPPLSQ
ncbi:MAG TPA: hypothetical protein DD396_08930 [Bacteroidetes bacterium]|nr:hypothetical protein [Bacteroidota bacterium]